MTAACLWRPHLPACPWKTSNLRSNLRSREKQTTKVDAPVACSAGPCGQGGAVQPGRQGHARGQGGRQPQRRRPLSLFCYLRPRRRPFHPRPLMRPGVAAALAMPRANRMSSGLWKTHCLAMAGPQRHRHQQRRGAGIARRQTTRTKKRRPWPTRAEAAAASGGHGAGVGRRRRKKPEAARR